MTEPQQVLTYAEGGAARLLRGRIYWGCGLLAVQAAGSVLIGLLQYVPRGWTSFDVLGVVAPINMVVSGICVIAGTVLLSGSIQPGLAVSRIVRSRAAWAAIVLSALYGTEGVLEGIARVFESVRRYSGDAFLVLGILQFLCAAILLAGATLYVRRLGAVIGKPGMVIIGGSIFLLNVLLLLLASGFYAATTEFAMRRWPDIDVFWYMGVNHRWINPAFFALSAVQSACWIMIAVTVARSARRSD